MTKLSETPLSPKEALQEAKSLENELFELLSARGPLDPRVQQLNNKIRDCYEKIILADHAFAESHDVENAIWNLHYKQIDDLRSRVNRTKNTSTAGDASGASVSRGGRRSFSQRESVLEAFKRFIVESSGFYHELILKLRAKYGLPLDSTNGASTTGLHESKALELKRYNRSCHKCYVCLGDYARYKEYYASSKPGNFDFSIAAGFYRKAISFWPSIGQPHNQMAVLATYVGDDLLAAYHYFRSLAIEKPFPTRENLTLLFEQNRLKYHQLTAAVESPLSKQDTSKGGRGAKASIDRDSNVAKRNAAQEVSNELINNFCVRFVRLNGILFTKTSLETFEEVCSAALCDLEGLLALDDANLEEVLGSRHCIGMESGNPGAAAALQLISVLICTVHNDNGGLNGNHSTHADVFQRTLLFKHAITASLEIVGRILCRCAETNDISNSPLLPFILVVLEWLACRPDMALGVEADETQLKAWSFFWKQCVILLNRLFYKNKVNGNVRDGLETSLCMEDCEIGIALWEDHELQGFSPLAPAHCALDFSRRGFGNISGTLKEKYARMQRLLAAGKAIVSVLGGRGIGILFDEDLRKFYLEGEKPEKEPYLNALNGSLDTEIHRSTGVSVTNGATPFQERMIPAKALPTKQTSGEDEDEELIVFKPALKVQPTLTAGLSFDNTAVSPLHGFSALELQAGDSAIMEDEPVLVSGMTILKNGLPYSNGLAHTNNKLDSVSNRMSSVSNRDSSVTEMAFPPRSAFAFSIPGINCANENSSRVSMVGTLLKDVDLKNIGAFCNPITRPLSAQSLLKQTGMPSMGMRGTLSSSVGNVGILSQGCNKVSNSAGVIGRPNQFANFLPEQTHKCPGQVLADPYKFTSEGLIVGQECCPTLSVPLSVKSFTSGQFTPLMSEKPSEKVNNKFYVNKSSKLATSFLSKASQSLASPIMRPPPGFGPRPIHPSVNGVESAATNNQGQLNSQQAGNEQQVLDDYCWLDDYEPSKPMSNYGEKQRVLPGYSTDYNLWCSDTSKSVKPEIRAFPFPMMQASQFCTENEHLQNSAILMKQQPLQNPDDKEGWSLFGATIPSDWTSTIFS